MSAWELYLSPNMVRVTHRIFHVVDITPAGWTINFKTAQMILNHVLIEEISKTFYILCEPKDHPWVHTSLWEAILWQCTKNGYTEINTVILIYVWLKILNTSFGISKYTENICSEMSLIQFCNHIYAKLNIGKYKFYFKW